MLGRVEELIGQRATAVANFLGSAVAWFHDAGCEFLIQPAAATITLPTWLVAGASKMLPKIAGKDLKEHIDIEGIIAAAQEPGANGVVWISRTTRTRTAS